MKKIIRNIGILALSLLIFSCDRDFPEIKHSEQPFLGEGSPIVVSPDWAVKDHIVYYKGAGTSRFIVNHIPSWLDISSLSGQFIDNMISLECKVNKFDPFSKIGFYCSYIVLSIENKGNLIIPVVYITEGDPAIEIPDRLTIEKNNLHKITLPIKNIGNGILTWSVSEYPEWLSLNNSYGVILVASIPVSALPQNEKGFIEFSYNQVEKTSSENLSGKIVITTNDKNKPEVEVEIDVGLETLHSLHQHTTLQSIQSESP
ncbi:MAG: hypothetical protein LBQ60_18410 [Bacteroidales bacterium]|jgi:hypothetical protein|nr:hypothetical protein [Bacteroidales bacterium]